MYPGTRSDNLCFETAWSHLDFSPLLHLFKDCLPPALLPVDSARKSWHLRNTLWDWVLILNGRTLPGILWTSPRFKAAEVRVGLS